MEAPTNLKDTEMKITLNNAEIVTILVNYMEGKFPGKYTCELLTTYIASKVPGQYVCDFDTRSYTLTATIETFEVSDAQ